ncbi:MFS transporter [Curtobacterium sp. MCBD17_019]|uniref:MFS transporter n=1 Tax=Curtobacterium sp. MCBD17_019 TaxID=2175669 RepID=UPI000DA8FCE0|nr:MFS transporter [Curtobacterium sp. MCBD17_019]PZE75314.1 MFS transporter [Curtobacterium sp. MCBD17_019]
MSSRDATFDLRAVALSAFLPATLFAIGEGAIIPIIPIAAHSLGATLAFAGFVASLILVGELIGDVPSGWVVAAIGERTAMIGAALVSIVGLLVAVWSPNAVVLAVGVFLVGVSTAVFALARHAYMTTSVPIAIRARALSTLGGVFRFGYFVGPFLSAGLTHVTGSTQSAFWIHVVCCLAAAGVLLVVRDPVDGARGLRVRPRASRPSPARPAAASADPGGEAAREGAEGLFGTIRRHRAVLLRLGSGAGLIGAMRAGRQVILPLWAVSVGMDDSTAALVIGIAGAIDFALFYTSGQIMDRFGRLASALPCLGGLSLCYFLLAWSDHLDTRVVWFVGVAMLMSLANGVGSGILMTLGADLAPRMAPAPFLGAWRFTGDFGSAAAPLVISGVTAVASIAVASGVMGVLGIVGVGVLLRYVPRYLPRPLR